MKVNIITIFPDLLKSFFNNNIIRKALEKDLLNINIVDLRAFSLRKNKGIDDYCFSGEGMLIQIEPLYLAMKSLKGKIIYTSPQGIKLNQNLSKELSLEKELTIICGHYEGIDERFMELFEVLEISIGDYVLSGGELPSLVIVDSIIRLIPNVIKDNSKIEDSFYNNLLDHPSYTRPREFLDKKVPEVLFSGNHSQVESWKKLEKIKRTFFRRPELLKGKLNKEEKEYLKNLCKDILEEVI